MVNLLGKLFVKNYKDTENADVRRSWGTLVSIIGICANILLFTGKIIVGTVFGAVSITADAVNNLSDSGSQLLSLVSFKLSGKPADAKHPYGHARIEYIFSLLVSVLIVVIGYSAGRDSIEKIMSGDKSVFSWISVGVLCGSILVKVFLGLLNRSVGKRINSSVMEATTADSFSDCIATGAVLLSQMVLFFFPKVDLDAYLGIAVAIIIIWAGIKILREMIDMLLGEGEDPELVKEISDFILSHEGILGVHDMMTHRYGPSTIVLSVHCEVDGEKDVFVTHDIIDNIERELFDRMHIVATIHLDPIVTNDAETENVKSVTIEKMKEIDPGLKIHDFRFVKGPTHTNLIFDIAAPFECKLSDSEIEKAAAAKMKEVNEGYNLVVKIDRGFN